MNIYLYEYIRKNGSISDCIEYAHIKFNHDFDDIDFYNDDLYTYPDSYRFHYTVTFDKIRPDEWYDYMRSQPEEMESIIKEMYPDINIKRIK